MEYNTMCTSWWWCLPCEISSVEETHPVPGHKKQEEIQCYIHYYILKGVEQEPEDGFCRKASFHLNLMWIVQEYTPFHWRDAHVCIKC